MMLDFAGHRSPQQNMKFLSSPQGKMDIQAPFAHVQRIHSPLKAHPWVSESIDFGLKIPAL